MNTAQLNELLATQDVKKIKTVLETVAIVQDIEEALKQIDPAQHEIFNPTERPDKRIYKENDPIGGDFEKTLDKTVLVSRLPLPFQKKIVRTAVTFLGNPEIVATTEGEAQEKLFAIMNKVFKDNKLQYRFKSIAKYTMGEKQAAELWYTEEAPQGYWGAVDMQSKRKLRVRILAQSLGDTLYPVFDGYGDLIAFGRGYELEEVDGLTDIKHKYEHLDVYTQDRFYYFTKKDGGEWEGTRDMPDELTGYIGDGGIGIPNPWGKIPVIYYSQPHTEWADVQELIERMEVKISNHADTNDYYDSPIVFAEGDIEGFANKGEEGKVLQGKNGAKVSYLTWDSAPESMRMELDNLWKYIHVFTSTPDISFENMKGLGTFSGIALKMLFMDAHMKASDHAENFGESVQRRLNFIKAMVAKLDPRHTKAAMELDLEPQFTYFLPENTLEDLDILIKAMDNKLLSRQTALERNPMIEDPEEEQRRMDEEADKAAKKALNIAAPGSPAPGTPPVPPVPGPGDEPV